MQSEQALRKLGEVDRELIEQRLHMLLELRAKGELRAMLDFAAEDIVYNVRGNWMAFPYVKPISRQESRGRSPDDDRGSIRKSRFGCA